MGVGGNRHAQAALSPGKTRYPFYRRLGVQQGRSGRVRKISPPIGIQSPDPSSILYTHYFPSFTANCCTLLSTSSHYVRCAVHNSPKSNEFTTLALQNTTGNNCTMSHVQQHCTWTQRTCSWNTWSACNEAVMHTSVKTRPCQQKESDNGTSDVSRAQLLYATGEIPSSVVEWLVLTTVVCDRESVSAESEHREGWWGHSMS